MQNQSSQPKPRVQPISVWIKGGHVFACPDPADINVGDSVEWVFRPDEDGEVIGIEFETRNGLRGPFPKREDDPDHNPSEGVYRKTGKGDVITAPARKTVDSVEYWKYTASHRNLQGDVVRLDPIIIVRATQN